MKKSKQILAFEQLEAEMELISLEEQLMHLGGAGAQDIVDYMMATGKTTWSNSSTGDVVGFSTSSFSSGGYYGSGGSFWGISSSGSSSSGYGSNGSGGNGANMANVTINIDTAGAYLVDNQMYYSSDGIPYRKVSFNLGGSWQAETLNPVSTVPSQSGVISTFDNGYVSEKVLYVSSQDASFFMNSIQDGLSDAGLVVNHANLLVANLQWVPNVAATTSMISKLMTFQSAQWSAIETRYNNAGQHGLVITQTWTTLGSIGGGQTVYTVEDTMGNRLGTVTSPGYGM